MPRKIFVVINPAAGKDEPILNICNDVFRSHDIAWEVGITHKYGDARKLARQAADAGYDLVAGYGGDGTQHEIANALVGREILMGVLPGGTGNGFCHELGLPKELRPALEIICTSETIHQVDVVRLGEEYFIQRLYVGIEPEEQTSRELKDKYGTLAYAISGYKRLTTLKDIHYRITIDDEVCAIRLGVAGDIWYCRRALRNVVHSALMRKLGRRPGDYKWWVEGAVA